MMSHDCVAFYLLSEEVSKHVKVVQSGQGADEIFAGYHWYPPMAHAADDDRRRRAVAATARRSSTATTTALNATAAARSGGSTPTSRATSCSSTSRIPGAATATDRALRLDTTVMLVDDPVKRVDNMTMAWGLEGRVPFLDHELVELAATCPPELKTAYDGKGVLKEAARKVIPHEVIDRPKGYFPVPALKHLAGPYLDLVRDALHSSAARDRGLFAPDAVDALLADPNGNLTPLRGNPLWQIGFWNCGWPATSTESSDHDGRRTAKPEPVGVVQDLGWGRLVFGQTCDDPEQFGTALRAEASGRRDIGMYLDAPHVFVALHPQEFFIDPSFTYRVDLTKPLDYEPAAGARPVGAPGDRRSRTARRSTRSTCSAGWCPPTST